MAMTRFRTSLAVAYGSTSSSFSVQPIPSTLRTLRITGTVRSTTAAVLDQLGCYVNSSASVDNAHHWFTSLANGQANTFNSTSSVNQTYQMLTACMPAAGVAAGIWGSFETIITGWDMLHSAVPSLAFNTRGGFNSASTASYTDITSGTWRTAGPYTWLVLFFTAGSIFGGSQIMIEGWG